MKNTLFLELLAPSQSFLLSFIKVLKAQDNNCQRCSSRPIGKALAGKGHLVFMPEHNHFNYSSTQSSCLLIRVLHLEGILESTAGKFYIKESFIFNILRCSNHTLHISYNIQILQPTKLENLVGSQ